MKIKNLTKLFFAIIAATFMFTSCGEDETFVRPDETNVSYKIVLGIDLLQFYDVTVTYTDAKGKTNTEIMTTETWQFKDRASGYGGPIHIDALAKLKENYTIGEKTDLDLTYTLNVNLYTQKNGAHNPFKDHTEGKIVKVEDIDKYLKEHKAITLINYTKS